ncbi:Sulfotransferase domain [Trinorchestia longiramus]|nr:Sulfotransferase domain [Trinorchestia longiramus]
MNADDNIHNQLQSLMIGEIELSKEYEAVNNELLLIKKILEEEKIKKDVNSLNPYEQGSKLKIVKNQNHTIRVKPPEYSDAKELILLVSSLGRGGSSWLAELLTHISTDTVYVFEPLKIVPDFLKLRSTPDIEADLLSKVFTCQFTDDFSKFNKQWPSIFKYFRHNCSGGNCLGPNELRSQCRAAEAVVSKTIRLPLADVEVLLTRPSLQHLKIIYLARDPRAQILSRRDVFKIKRTDFTPDCERVESDVYAFHRLSTLFPGQLFFLRYEDLCQNPIDQASQLWKFLRTDSNASLPNSWIKFLTSHDENLTTVDSSKKKSRTGAYTTYRNSSSQWYKWREEKNITTGSLVDVESLCSNAMDRLGYVPLKTIENVKNLSLPFIREYNCDFWNCWTHRF